MAKRQRSNIDISNDVRCEDVWLGAPCAGYASRPACCRKRASSTLQVHGRGCQNYALSLGTLHVPGYIIPGAKQGTRILTTHHIGFGKCILQKTEQRPGAIWSLGALGFRRVDQVLSRFLSCYPLPSA